MPPLGSQPPRKHRGTSLSSARLFKLGGESGLRLSPFGMLGAGMCHSHGIKLFVKQGKINTIQNTPQLSQHAYHTQGLDAACVSDRIREMHWQLFVLAEQVYPAWQQRMSAAAQRRLRYKGDWLVHRIAHDKLLLQSSNNSGRSNSYFTRRRRRENVERLSNRDSRHDSSYFEK
jgi:hypothetical protein